MTALISGTFSATGNSAVFSPRSDFMNNNYTLSIWGTFSASVQLEREFDNSGVWQPITIGGAQAFTYTAPASEDLVMAERGVLFRLSCTWGSGAVSYRVGQTQ